MTTSIHDKFNQLTNKAADLLTHNDSSKSSTNNLSVGQYLAKYLIHVGVDTMFVVPGDYNLVLLDELLKPISTIGSDSTELNMVCCTNELNTGYSADGYCRVKGISALVITHSVGSLSCINAVAGAYAEHLPMIVISGGLNSNSITDGEIVHHSLTDTHLNQYDYVRSMYEKVTVSAVSITRAADAPHLIHKSINAALRHSRPVLIDIACNIAALPTNTQYSTKPVILPNVTRMRHVDTDIDSLNAAVQHTIDVIDSAKSHLIITGQHLRPFTIWQNNQAKNSVIELIELLNTAFVSLLDGKTMLNEAHSNYLGIYSANSSVVPGQRGSGDNTGGNALNQTVLDTELLIYIGCVLSDYATAGHTIRSDIEHCLYIDQESVTVQGQIYHSIQIYDFITELVKQGRTTLKANNTSLQLFKQLQHSVSKSYKATDSKVQGEIDMKLQKFPLNLDSTAKITTNTLNYKLQDIIDHTAAANQPLHVIAETGDAWFHVMKLKLPYPHSMDIQMQYGSIGWSVGGVNGCTVALSKTSKRVVGIIGDGSFQLTAQEISTMIRYQHNPVIIILNNHDYVIEEEIHPGSYNRINNWQYSKLPDVFSQGVYGIGIKNKPISYNCSTVAELSTALNDTFNTHTDRFVLIEVQLDPKDSNVELGIWANPVAQNNARKPGTHVAVKSTQ